jgi:two-component system, OmpR family, phosphate regulon sensor histidine kinase PhoR
VRGRNVGETRVRGSGIGLALVKHIAESHGGSVRVSSPITDDARGCAFEVSIPITAEAKRAPEGPEAEGLSSAPASEAPPPAG